MWDGIVVVATGGGRSRACSMTLLLTDLPLVTFRSPSPEVSAGTSRSPDRIHTDVGEPPASLVSRVTLRVEERKHSRREVKLEACSRSLVDIVHVGLRHAAASRLYWGWDRGWVLVHTCHRAAFMVLQM